MVDRDLKIYIWALFSLRSSSASAKTFWPPSVMPASPRANKDGKDAVVQQNSDFDVPDRKKDKTWKPLATGGRGRPDMDSAVNIPDGTEAPSCAGGHGLKRYLTCVVNQFVIVCVLCVGVVQISTWPQPRRGNSAGCTFWPIQRRPKQAPSVISARAGATSGCFNQEFDVCHQGMLCCSPRVLAKSLHPFLKLVPTPGWLIASLGVSSAQAVR